MGKKGSWIQAIKRALTRKSKKSRKLKNKFDSENSKSLENPCPALKNAGTSPISLVEIKLNEAENEQNKQAHSVAIATAAAAAVDAAQAAAEVVRLTSGAQYAGNSGEELAAIKIQTAFRGYLARRALRSLRGLVRLKSLTEGQSVKRQTANTLRCMQTVARIQSLIWSRRISVSEENLRCQLLQKHEKELENLSASIGDEWDDSIQSKEQIEASLLNKKEATVRRERALAYAYTHQQPWKNFKSANSLFMDPNYPYWGWCWLERWMAARPWDSRTSTQKERHDSGLSKSASCSIGNDVSKGLSHREWNKERPLFVFHKPRHPGSCQSTSTPPSKASSVAGKSRLVSPRGGGHLENDTRSSMSLQSEWHRRHSIAGSSMRDDESLASSPASPNYMASTESARAKARLRSPLGDKKHEPTDRLSVGSAKKRLSFIASPAGPRRHSGPPKVDASNLKEIDVNAGHDTTNNGGGM